MILLFFEGWRVWGCVLDVRMLLIRCVCVEEREGDKKDGDVGLGRRGRETEY